MALSEQLTRLADRAKETEDRYAAAQAKAKVNLEQDVKEARESAQEQADALDTAIDQGKDKVSAWWTNVQRSWNEQMADMHRDIDEKRATHDLKAAQRRADSAEEDAGFAVELAYGAVVEAEYAVLDAALARVQADELAAAQ